MHRKANTKNYISPVTSDPPVAATHTLLSSLHSQAGVAAAVLLVQLPVTAPGEGLFSDPVGYSPQRPPISCDLIVF